jgi:hypothetical protein
LVNESVLEMVTEKVTATEKAKAKAKEQATEKEAKVTPSRLLIALGMDQVSAVLRPSGQ